MAENRGRSSKVVWGAALLALTLALLVGALPSHAQKMSWQDAVFELKGEKTRAEGCASLLKKHGSNEQIDSRESAYTDAKAEIDALIAGLIVVLAQGDDPPSLASLEERLKNGVNKREAFCAEVKPLVPKEEGTRSVFIDVFGKVIGPLIDAAVALYQHKSEKDALTRKTIQTQLEGAKWDDFANINA